MWDTHFVHGMPVPCSACYMVSCILVFCNVSHRLKTALSLVYNNNIDRPTVGPIIKQNK